MTRTHATSSALELVVARDVTWAPAPNAVSVTFGDPPAGGPVTAAFAFVTRTVGGVEQLLLVNVRARGWDVPGGHVEDGEDVRGAICRELVEEAGLAVPADAAVTKVGTLHLHVQAPAPSGYAYPHPDSYMVVVHVPVGPDCTAAGTTVPAEIVEHAWVPVAEVPDRVGSRTWVALLAGLPKR